jgi:hypothetical protein
VCPPPHTSHQDRKDGNSFFCKTRCARSKLHSRRDHPFSTPRWAVDDLIVEHFSGTS